MQMLLRKIHCKFQSTPPVKAATVLPFTKSTYATISIHAAREGGDSTIKVEPFGISISIHAAREGGDMDAVRYFIQTKNFNPRRP